MTKTTRSDDIASALRLIGGMVGTFDSANVLVIPGEPRSKARPRFSGGGRVYTPTKQVEAERLLGWHFKRAYREPLTGNLALACIFYRSNQSRVDVDNMLKHVMDAANRICWKDDYQVTAILGVVELDRENPRTVVTITPHSSSLSRASLPDRKCDQCGESFQMVSSSPNRRFCSKTCRGAARTASEFRATVACPHCAKTFVRRSGQIYCSEPCRIAGWKKKRPVRRTGKCVQCGKTPLDGRAVRCRDCWRQSLQGKRLGAAS